MKKNIDLNNMKKYLDALNNVMCRDRYALEKNLQKIISGNKSHDGKRFKELTCKIEKSIMNRESRIKNLPSPSFSQQLPVIEVIEDIKQGIRDNPVVIISGETGSGKTTQLPKICLTLGRGTAGYIGHTQPRRIAAKSIAHRIAEELDTTIGNAVGYKVRFQDKVKSSSYIKLMTDGILLAEIQSDRYLTQYDTIIIDEAHERNLNIDFLLGYLKKILPRRPDLKLIITSATIDTEKFSRHFDNAPVIEVSGRTYPVEVEYMPVEDQQETENGSRTQNAIAFAIESLSQYDPVADVLVFLSGEREIRDTEQFLSKRLNSVKDEILPLFSRLNARDQAKIFQPGKKRRIILSTNIAETSLTVPGIKFVIDTGYARLNRYNYKSKVQRLPIEKISQSNANQRKGRCGRVSNGICIRLYSEEDFLSRPVFQEPEIKRVNLAAVILQLKYMKMGHIDDFPFLEPPDSQYIKDGYKLLYEIMALDDGDRLTEIGRKLAKIPLDPKIGRMVIAAHEYRALSEILVIASAISIQDPRERPMDFRDAADEKHNQYKDVKSDFLLFLNIWKQFHGQTKNLSNTKTRKWCVQHYLSYQRMREWQDIYNQLNDIAVELNFRKNSTPAKYEDIHKALLTGLLGNIGIKKENSDYSGARNIAMSIFPGSGLFKNPPKWIVCAELIETSKLYAHTVAKIEPEWLVDLASHLSKHQYTEPHWDRKQCRVMAFESISLYGLPIAVNKKVSYEIISPKESRELFIRVALVEGELNENIPFYQHNQQLMEKIRKEEEKARTTGFLVSEDTMYSFYDKVIPEEVCSTKSLKQWLSSLAGDESAQLFFTEEFLTNSGFNSNKINYPETIELNNIKLKLKYHFKIGDDRDGITVTIPYFLINQIPAYAFDWLVPGLLKEKVVALIKSLPKKFRRSFVPAPDFASACLEACKPYEEPLIDSLTRHLKKMSGVEIPDNAWNLQQIPGHLIINFEIVDDKNEVLYFGKDIEQAKKHALQKNEQKTVEPGNDTFLVTTGIVRWDFGKLQEQETIELNGYDLTVFPALVPSSNYCSIKRFEDPVLANSIHVSGVTSLFMLQQKKKINYLEKNLPKMDKSVFLLVNKEGSGNLFQDIVYKAVETLLFRKCGIIRDPESFQAASEYTSANIIDFTNEICRLISEIAKNYNEVSETLNGNIPAARLSSVHDIKSQIDMLFFPGFVRHLDIGRLKDYPRFLSGIILRLNKLNHSLPKDLQRLDQIKPFWDQYIRLRGNSSDININEQTLDEYHWLLQEMRISLFAQELGTGTPVSIKRLDEFLKHLQSS